ncbi:DEAD/DEAH box helicase [Bacillus weihaiensis]|uniref:Helicase n=1 Tax=Bacillus weihaiensis TaxID=1547283 RepID=A0A1L3MMI3_9BACI|nr:DEAD/DEAH box helicase [Bacillus weihaiensis]APH03570.1 helicase [Bacillus weihaiensis]
MRFILKDQCLSPTFLHQEGLPFSRIEALPHISTNYQFNHLPQLQSFLSGKELLLSEIPFPVDIIHTHYENGCIQLNYGITKKQKTKCCHRCGNQDEHLFASFDCAKCGEKDCTYCRKCIMMGRVSECTPLYYWSGPEEKSSSQTVFTWEGTLSPGQMQASEKVVSTIKENKEILVWAVCGAGKTEVLFEGIYQALKDHKRVCIATPRTDVVLELAPRLKKVFPETSISALYGGSDDKAKPATLVISTTHQLLRFKEAFDVIIVDEVDAFPYTADQSLQFAVQKSRKKQSSLIYLTATPSQTWKKEVALNRRPFVKIPARYHGHPLPVPEFHWCGNWKKQLTKNQVPAKVIDWLKERLGNDKQAFLFVPSIQVIDQVVTICQKLDSRILGVHAEDPERRQKVTAFRNKEIPIIVTSTILERGVTIPNSDVAILGSEEEIFTESALVQISGRVGRSAAYPTGVIRFFHFGKTKAMIDAKRHICQMNEEAMNNDYITIKR